MRNVSYYTRIFQAYLGRGNSQLSFWHGEPLLNENAFDPPTDQFYMRFHQKARYEELSDRNGVPLLDYRGEIGPQYNPIAIAQYGLGCWNLWCDGAGDEWRAKAVTAMSWHVSNLRQNDRGQWVWMHEFDWEYFRTLKAPWYSGLAQGLGVALLVRASQMGVDDAQKHAASLAAARALETMLAPVADGGTLFIDDDGSWWIEEYITEPATHILNGHMWALWGVRDFVRQASDSDPLKEKAQKLWDEAVATLERQLDRFDTGYWSMYDQAPTRIRNVASPFYHQLHLTQLQVMHRLTGKNVFRQVYDRWHGYQENVLCRKRAYATKALFKLAHY